MSRAGSFCIRLAPLFCSQEWVVAFRQVKNSLHSLKNFWKTHNSPPSDGYILVDTKKCQGCVSCMLACSLVHEGVESLSLSRIQVIQNSFKAFPGDLTIEQCRQCVNPACIEQCPENALIVDAVFGIVRMMNRSKCIGCETCVDACPFTPSRPIVAADGKIRWGLQSQKM